MEFILAGDGRYYDHNKIVSLYRISYGQPESARYEVLIATFVGGLEARLFTSNFADIPGDVDNYLREHDLKMVK